MYRSLLTLILIAILAGAIALVAVGQTAPEAPAIPAAAEAAPAGQDTPAPAAAAADAPPPSAPSPAPFQSGDATVTVIIPDRPIDLKNDLVSIAFSKADLINVLNFLSMATGIPIVVDAEVRGTVTINSMRKVPLPLAYEVINSALRARGYTMVGNLQDKLIRVTTLGKAVVDRATVQVGADIEKIGTSDSFVTQVIPVQHISAARLRDELKPLVADGQANLLAVTSANTLIVTDTEGNVRRLVQLVNLLDIDTSDVMDVEVYSCKFANAAAMIVSLEKVFGVTSTPIGTPQQPQPSGGRGGQPGQPPNQPTVQTDEGPLTLKGELHLAADERTNSIIISASKEKMALVRKLVEKLDIDTTSEVLARVFPLKFADANMVATQLNTLFEQPQGGAPPRSPFFGGGSSRTTTTTPESYASLKRNLVVADVRTNSVVVTATKQNMQQFEVLIEQLDAPNVLSDIARSFQLKYATAATMATTLNNLFRGRSTSFFDVIVGNRSTQGDPISQLRTITVVADQKTNTLLITGPPQAFPMVESIIAQLDRRTPQVFIQVAIVDVTLDDSNKFGIEWQWSSSPGSSTVHSVGPAFDLAAEKFGLKYSVISDNLQALLHALTTRSNVKVYSTPSITTADNVAATISIGQDIPFVSSSEVTSSGNVRETVDFKNVSITLNVTPHVTAASDLITMDVQQTINELIGREIQLNAPIIANRLARTTVMVKDGQTIVIGGIIKENEEDVKKAVPILSKIPLLGELFKSSTTIKQKSELMVFLTPHILKDDDSVDTRREIELDKLTNPLPPIIEKEMTGN
jgi:general secretion pathway protein D